MAASAGILPYQHVKRLIHAGHIRAAAPITDDQVQPASLDLRLGPVAYRVRASFLPPENARVMDRVSELQPEVLDLGEGTILERGCVYIIPLQEELDLPPDLFGRANPKSTTGRLDVFTRLITDGGGGFEHVPPGYRGPLYAEVAPRTFSIRVRAGDRLNQLRFVRGAPGSSDSLLNELDRTERLVYLPDDRPGEARIANGLWISVDLRGADSAGITGYRARQWAPVIDLARVGHYDPAEFWDPIVRPRDEQIILNPGEFYILASREKIRVPPTFAAELVGYDPSVGEFRIHYAGFFDPGFGYGSDDIKGTRAVLEVRSHEVPFLLRHGQRVGRFLYEPLLEAPEKVYGPAIGSSYQRQRVALSKQFRKE